MASKLLFFLLVVAICKIQAQTVKYIQKTSAPKPQPNNNNKNNNCNVQQPTQPPMIKIPPCNCNNGIQASPKLQIVPGQTLNLQAIPVSQLGSQNFQQRGPRQKSVQNLPQTNVQVTSTPQPQVQPLCPQILQPSLCNPTTVITAPVSSITIPPSSGTTVIDNSLSNSLASALQMMIANEFITNMINQDCDLSFLEAIPGINLTGLLKNLNVKPQDCQVITVPCKESEPCTEPEPCDSLDKVTPQDWSRLLDKLGKNEDNCYDWSSVQDFLKCQNLPKDQAHKNPKHESPDIPDLSCLIQYGQTIDQIVQNQIGNQVQNYNPQVPYGQSYNPQDYCGKSYSPQGSYGQNYSPQDGKNYSPQGSYGTSYSPQDYGKSDKTSKSAVIDAIAAYLCCDPSEVSSNTYPSVGGIQFPDEIPAQLICNYGYMPTTVPVVSFSVQPLTGEYGNNFLVGGKCQ